MEIDPKRRAEIEAALDFASDFPDGAWGGYLFVERGFDPEEVAEVAKAVREREAPDA